MDRDREGSSPRGDAHVFRFIGYFSAFNACYWLWGLNEVTSKSSSKDLSRDEFSAIKQVLDGVDAGLRKNLLDRCQPRPAGEIKQVRGMAARLGRERAEQILASSRVLNSIGWLMAQQPLRDMNKRDRDPVGDWSKGEKYKEQLSRRQPDRAA